MRSELVGLQSERLRGSSELIDEFIFVFEYG